MQHLAVGKHISVLLDIKQATLRNWIEGEDIDSGERHGVSSKAAQVTALRADQYEPGGGPLTCNSLVEFDPELGF